MKDASDATPRAVAGRPTVWLVAALFAVSGASALALEIVWFRWLALALGSSAIASTVVLATFMGGLGLGAALAWRAIDRARPERLLLGFALAETVIGCWALASTLVLHRGLPAAASSLARAFDLEGLPLFWRIALAVAALLPPTMAMGATLPWLARWAEAARSLPARGVGLFYVANTLGGVAGILAATFYAIDRLGLTRTAMLAGVLEMIVAAIAALLWWRTRAVNATDVGSATAVTSVADRSRSWRLALAAYFVSGFVGLGLEVTAHRILVMLAGSSVYAFAVMLSAFLLGIAAGAVLAAWLAASRWPTPVLLGASLGWLALGTAFALRMATLGGWGVAGRLASKLPLVASTSYGFELAGYLATLLPATVALGAIVPLVARMVAECGRDLTRDFGAAYAWNTAGAVLGSSLAGFVLIPWLGTAKATLGLAMLAGLAGVAVLALDSSRPRRAPAIAVSTLAVVAAVALGWGADPARANLDALLSEISGEKREVYFEEGPVQTLSVFEVESDKHLPHLRMLTNRVSLTATALYARRYMEPLGHLPVLWAREPRRALVIGLGTGITAGAVARHPQLESVVVAEISPEIVSAAPLFAEVNGDVLSDPRVELDLEDGRHRLLAAREPWDVITLEPPPPRDAGVVSLYSRDFYELCRSRLAPGGVLAQWIPLHSQSETEMRMLVRSFLSAMPYALGFLPVNRDLVLLGADRPLTLDFDALAAAMNDPVLARGLAEIGFDSPESLLATAVAGREALERFAGQVPAVTDDRPAIEYFVRFGKRGMSSADVRALLASPLELDDLLDRPSPAADLIAFDGARRALFASLESGWRRLEGDSARADELAELALGLRPDDAYYLWEAGLSDAHLARRHEKAMAAGDFASWVDLGVMQAKRGLWDDAVVSMRTAERIAPREPEVLLRLGLVLMQHPEPQLDEAHEALARFVAIAPDHPRAAAARQYLATAR